MPELRVFDPTMQAAVSLFFAACAAELSWAYEPQGRHRDVAHVAEAYMQGGCFWCLICGPDVVGTVAVRDMGGGSAELKRLYLLAAYQGRGLGGLLFQTALDYARAAGFAQLYADTRADRAASIHLMRKHGFAQIEQYNDNAFAELFFRLTLREGGPHKGADPL